MIEITKKLITKKPGFYITTQFMIGDADGYLQENIYLTSLESLEKFIMFFDAIRYSRGEDNIINHPAVKDFWVSQMDDSDYIEYWRDRMWEWWAREPYGGYLASPRGFIITQVTDEGEFEIEVKVN